MSVTTTLLSAAAKHIEQAFQAVLAVPEKDEAFAYIAWELNEIKNVLELKVETIKASRDDSPRQEKLKLGE